ncbi:MAG: dTMP kinase [Anaerolineales bacterium]|nr:dTMP kinase [Anaerolineales bacterium]
MFITFEGPDGSGKTSQMAELAAHLHECKFDLLATREPGGTIIGDQIRAILLAMENQDMHPRTETLLFQASRAQLVEECIRPHLAKGGVVLCDRYADSTIAYQGYGYKVDIKQVRAIVDFATGCLTPDLTLLLDLDVEEGLRRRAGGGSINRLDAYELAFHQRVRDGYLLLANADPGRWVVVDADRSFEQVQIDIRQIVMKRLGQPARS